MLDEVLDVAADAQSLAGETMRVDAPVHHVAPAAVADLTRSARTVAALIALGEETAGGRTRRSRQPRHAFVEAPETLGRGAASEAIDRITSERGSVIRTIQRRLDGNGERRSVVDVGQLARLLGEDLLGPAAPRRDHGRARRERLRRHERERLAAARDDEQGAPPHQGGDIVRRDLAEEVDAITHAKGANEVAHGGRVALVRAIERASGHRQMQLRSVREQVTERPHQHVEPFHVANEPDEERDGMGRAARPRAARRRFARRPRSG